MKEEVEMGVVFDEGSKDFCSYVEASFSGHGEFKKMSNNGTQHSILFVSPFSQNNVHKEDANADQ